MKILAKEKQILGPRPVHPRPVRHHGLLGLPFVRQHMVIDERWTADSLTHQMANMAVLLNKHVQFNHLEKKVQKRDLVKTCHNLQKQCRDGRSLLKSVRTGNFLEVKNILKDHRHMQRLYQKMPLHLIEENINQRTFILRKERDRLEDRLKQLEKLYEEKLLEKANIENHIKYENKYKLEEGEKIIDLMKDIENSEMRLKANMAINSTYKKVVQILQHDEKFYLPILLSLDADIEDQSKFLKHILQLGSPAITRFQELGNQYKLLDEKYRKTNRQHQKELFNYQKKLSKPQSKELKPQHPRSIFVKVRRYVRETRSMLDLKAKYEEVEETIKKIKIATICSDEKSIFSRIKSQMKNNLSLGSGIENNMLGRAVLETKMKCASVLQEVLVNNLAENEIMRLEKIKKLKEEIKRQDEIEESLLAHIKSFANIFVLLRLSLWNLHEIMRHVGPRKISPPERPVDHLKLPLLQYEMLPMKAYPPDAFEQNIMKLLRDVYSKLKRLTKVFDWEQSKSSINFLQNEFCREMVNITYRDSMSTGDGRYRIDEEPEIDLLEEVKSYRTVPNRNKIKLLSARLVEESIKRDD